MKRTEPTTLTRQELYELVWATPASRLREKLGVSDAAVYKTCKKYNIPKPPLGFWRKVEVGQKPKKPNLPSPTTGLEGPIKVGGPHAGKKEKGPYDDIIPELIPLPDDDIKLHPVCRKVRAAFNKQKPDPYGFIEVRTPELPHIRVSKGKRDTALKSLHLLSEYLEKHDAHLGESRYNGIHFNSGPFIKEREKIRISITETRERRPLNEGEKPKHWYDTEHIEPSGQLVFKLDYSHWFDIGGRVTWSETKRQTIEKIVPSILREMLSAYDRMIVASQKMHEESIRQEERKRIEKHQGHIRKHYEQATTNLEKAAYWHTRCREICDYLEYCVIVWEEKQPDGLNEQQSAWLKWAHQEALKLSPFSYSYPDVEIDGPIDHEAIPIGGPYPKHTKLPTIYRYTNKSIGGQNAKIEMDYGKDDAPYPFWLKYNK